MNRSTFKVSSKIRKPLDRDRSRVPSLSFAAGVLALSFTLGCSKKDPPAKKASEKASNLPAAGPALAASSTPQSEALELQSEATDSAQKARYGVNSALVSFRIEYEDQGLWLGTETRQFKAQGAFEHRERKVRPVASGLEQGADEIHSVTLLRGSSKITWDALTRQAGKLPQALELSLWRLSEIESAGTRVGSKDVAGLACNLWEVERLSARFCEHQGVVLEARVERPETKLHVVATKATLDAPVPDDLFTVPDDILPAVSAKAPAKIDPVQVEKAIEAGAQALRKAALED